MDGAGPATKEMEVKEEYQVMEIFDGADTATFPEN